MQHLNFPYKELCGTIHLHTKYSDGGIDYPTLINAAHDVGLDYVIVTDHMSLGGLENGFEGIRNNVIVLIGYEHHDAANLNHYLAIGVSKVYDTLINPQDYVTAIKDAGGIGFIAHPAEKRNYIGRFPPYPWTDWSVKDFDGLEIWNQMSEWVEQLKSWRSVVKLLYPRRFLESAPAELLHRWDNLNRSKFISGIGGVDAHTRKIGAGLFSFIVFPIKVELKGIRTHVYLPDTIDTENFSIIKQALLKSLRNGNSFISNFRRGDATGTKIGVVCENGEVNLPGINLCSSQQKSFFVELPEKAEIRLLFNSKVINKKYGSKACFDIEKGNGVYRIEAYKNGKAWVYSNPFPIGQYPL